MCISNFCFYCSRLSDESDSDSDDKRRLGYYEQQEEIKKRYDSMSLSRQPFYCKYSYGFLSPVKRLGNYVFTLHTT